MADCKMEYLGDQMETCGEQRMQKAEKEDEGDRTERKNSQEADLREDPGRDHSGRNQTEGKMKCWSGMCRKAKNTEHLGIISFSLSLYNFICHSCFPGVPSKWESWGFCLLEILFPSLRGMLMFLVHLQL